MLRNIVSGVILLFVWLIAAFWASVWWDTARYEAETVTAVALATLATLVFINERFAFNVNLRARPQPQPGKQKHPPESDTEAKMRVLLDMMDDDERAAFKQAMKQRLLDGDDNDATTLEALLREQRP